MDNEKWADLFQKLDTAYEALNALAQFLYDTHEAERRAEQENGPAQEASDEGKAEKAGKKEPPSFTEVRAVMAEKARAGYRAEMKALLAKHGAEMLSQITDPEELALLLAEAEAAGNG